MKRLSLTKGERIIGTNGYYKIDTHNNSKWYLIELEIDENGKDIEIGSTVGTENEMRTELLHMTGCIFNKIEFIQ